MVLFQTFQRFHPEPPTANRTSRDSVKPGAGYISNIAKDLKTKDVPYQPWAAALYNQRRKNPQEGRSDRCLRSAVFF